MFPTWQGLLTPLIYLAFGVFSTIFVLQFIDKGGLVPDEVMVKLISSELKKLEAQKVNWLLDGFPRTRNQAVALQGQAPVDAVVHLDVPFQTIIDRVKGEASFLKE